MPPHLSDSWRLKNLANEGDEDYWTEKKYQAKKEKAFNAWRAPRRERGPRKPRALGPCPPGKARNPATRRCKSDKYKSPARAARGRANAATSPWIAHVKATRASHPGISYKEAMKQAKETYRR